MTQGRIIGVISIKGGVGKTTTVSNLGAALSNLYNKKVLLIDANFTAPNLGLHLGVVNPKVTLHDVLSGKVNAIDSIYNHEFGFHIIPASLVNKQVDYMKLRDKIRVLKSYYDIILLDSSPNLNQEMLSTILASDELLVVTTPDYPTLSATMNAVRVAKQKKTPIKGLILNKVRNKKFELKIEDVPVKNRKGLIAYISQEMRCFFVTKPLDVFHNKLSSFVVIEIF